MKYKKSTGSTTNHLASTTTPLYFTVVHPKTLPYFAGVFFPAVVKYKKNKKHLGNTARY